MREWYWYYVDGQRLGKPVLAGMRSEKTAAMVSLIYMADDVANQTLLLRRLLNGPPIGIDVLNDAAAAIRL